MYAHLIAVGNRVLLRRGDHSFFPHVDLGFFVATALESDVLEGSSIHRAHGDCLLALTLFLHGVKEDSFYPGGNCCVRIGDFSAKVVCPKGGKVALLWISVVRPVGRTDLTLQEDQLSGVEGSAMTECPGVVMLIAERRRHGEATDWW